MSLRALKQYIELYHFVGITDFFLDSKEFKVDVLDSTKKSVQPVARAVQSFVPNDTRNYSKPPPARQVPDYISTIQTTDFALLQRKYSLCYQCSFAKTRMKLVYGAGNPQAQCLIIGNPPISDENVNGKPFMGQCGNLFDKMMAAIGLSRKDLYLTNITKCKPEVVNYNEIKKCLPILLEQISILKPKIILIFGEIAANGLFNKIEKIDFYRKNQGLLFQGIPVFVTYNPLDLIKDESLKKFAWEDLQLFRDRFKVVSRG